MTQKSSTTKQAVIDEYRHLTNQEYNVLMNHSGSHDRKKERALETYHRLVEAGYSPESAIDAVKKAFLFDVREYV